TGGRIGPLPTRAEGCKCMQSLPPAGQGEGERLGAPWPVAVGGYSCAACQNRGVTCMELKPRLLVVGLGGTISTLVGDRTDIVDYFETGEKKSAGEILSLLPEAARLADLRAVEMRSVSSSAV